MQCLNPETCYKEFYIYILVSFCFMLNSSVGGVDGLAGFVAVGYAFLASYKFVIMVYEAEDS